MMNDKENLDNKELDETVATENQEAESTVEPFVKENEELKATLAEQNDKYLRLMAEYDNYRKRTAQEKIAIYPEATAKAVETFLPLADNFERALNADTTDEAYKAGVKMIYNQLIDTFKKLGVEIIDRTGQEFDPQVENAVSQIVDENLGDNVVAQTLQKGYKLGDKIIRPAMVIVANC